MQLLPSLAPSLYCAEDADDVASWDAGDAWVTPPSPSSLPTVLIFPPSLHDPDRPISDLFAAEVEHMPRADYLARFQDGSLDCAARLNAVDWILKVNAFYHFRPVTATLAVNYLDRFLSSQTLPKGVGWPWQLLSVACLSVASKMEETQVPLLVDLQILEPRFVFEPRTVRRMELLLMSALRWRMRSVTPFDFVDHFAGLLHDDCPGAGEGYAPLFSRASDIILSTHRVLDFLGYRPSEIAAAAVLCASGENTRIISSFYDVVSKEAVEGCQLTYACLKGAPGGPVPPACWTPRHAGVATPPRSPLPRRPRTPSPPEPSTPLPPIRGEGSVPPPPPPPPPPQPVQEKARTSTEPWQHSRSGPNRLRCDVAPYSFPFAPLL